MSPDLPEVCISEDVTVGRVTTALKVLLLRGGYAKSGIVYDAIESSV